MARRLLVVDDEPHIGLLLRPRLEAAGFDVTLARTLADARAALAAALPERVLAELQRLGASVLTKPFSPSKLTAHLAELLGDAGAAETAS